MQSRIDEALITAYAMGELSAPQRSRMETELQRSPARRRELAEIRQVMGLLDRLHNPSAQTARGSRPTPAEARPARLVGLLAVAAGLLVAFLLGSVVSWRADSGAPPSIYSAAEASIQRGPDASPERR